MEIFLLFPYHSGGKELDELKTRREAEFNLWNIGSSQDQAENLTAYRLKIR
jgi:hypothetical protein